jgi:two-component system chemotaxis sensor kinase CheA
MLNLAGELALSQQLNVEHATQLQRLHTLAEQQNRALGALEEELARLRFSPLQRQAIDSRLDSVRALTREAQQLAEGQAEQFERHARSHDLLVKDLEQEVMAARLLPLATLYAGLPRAARDLAQSTGKAVRLELRDETVELDRKVLELVGDPLLHLLRNAIDHGLEPPAERLAAGKPAEGLITVSAAAVGGEVRLAICDDGRGIDPDRLRKRAAQLGLLSAEAAAALSDYQALDLIFQPGFSTAAGVSEISGRGVGMDVVRSNLAELGGQVRVESELGKGTRVALILPLTLATTRVLLARVGEMLFALPASSCRGATLVRRGELLSALCQPRIEREGQSLALASLAALIGIQTPWPLADAERAPAVIAGDSARPVALLVDALLDEREVVVRPLGALLAQNRAFSGAVQLSDGSLALLLSPFLLAQTGQLAPAVVERPRAPIRGRLLVVDDSFATRELIRSILQAAGYEVAVAVDGADGLEQLRASSYDLVVSDLEMPRLNGLQLAAQVKAGAAGRSVPLILLTSLGSDEQRRLGLEAGASAYIVKSQFSQESLLAVVRQLLDADR